MDKSSNNHHQQIEQLNQSANLINDFYLELTDPKKDNLPMTLCRSIAALTLETAEPGVALKDIRFTPKELRQKVLEIGSIKKSKQEDSEWVRDNWRKLEEELEQRKLHLQDFCKRNGAGFYPWIGKEESKGGQGKFSYYYLTANIFSEQEDTETVQFNFPEGGLHYVQESLAKIPFWARWVNGFTLQSWRKFAYLFPGMIILLVMIGNIWLLLMLGLYTKISTVKWVTSMLVSFGLGGMVLSSPLYRVGSNRIVMAPAWMIPLKETNVQLELKRIGIDPKSGDAIRKLRLVVYSAKCPICDGRVEVDGGGIQFPFRLIGRCNESPREHVYSFDHITRTGKPLIY